MKSTRCFFSDHVDDADRDRSADGELVNDDDGGACACCVFDCGSESVEVALGFASAEAAAAAVGEGMGSVGSVMNARDSSTLIRSTEASPSAHTYHTN